MTEPTSENYSFTPDELTRLIDERVAEAAKLIQAGADQRVQGLTDQVATLQAMLAGTPVSVIPGHGAGPYTEIRPTWSQYEQELAWHAHELSLNSPG